MIRPYNPADAEQLAAVHSAVFPDDPLSAAGFQRMAATSRKLGGRTWVVASGNVRLGYATTTPVPGLPYIADLNGCIIAARQRQGLGSLLLNTVLEDLRGGTVTQLSHHLSSLSAVGARFLQARGFYVEHQEWLLQQELKSTIAAPAEIDGLSIATFPYSRAVRAFAELYRVAFTSQPWDQPYADQEIEGALSNPADLLFLLAGDEPVGFAWLHLESADLGVIEPLGVVPAHQGRGYGRFLLQSALHELAGRGVTRAQIGAWASNRPAIHLYQSLGFVHQQTITYLAFDLAEVD